MLTVADVLGVPEADHDRFRHGFGMSGNPGAIAGEQVQGNALGWLDDWFADYIEERRREPRDDVLTRLALGTYPDGSHARDHGRRADGDVPLRRRARRRRPGSSPSA